MKEHSADGGATQDTVDRPGSRGGAADTAGALFTFDVDAWRSEPVAAFDAFLTHRRVNGRVLRKSSFVIYRGMFLRLLEWLQRQGLSLHDLQAPTLDAFLASRPLQAETRHRYLLVFTELYQHLALLRALEPSDTPAGRAEGHNPARELLTAQPAPERAAPEALTPQEVQRLRRQLALERALPGWKHQRLVAMATLLLGAGLRSTELLTLRLKSLERPHSCWVAPRKPRPERVVPLLGPAQEATQRWLLLRDELRIPGELVYPGNLAGAPLAASTLFRQVQALLSAADIDRRYEGPTLLRNTCAAAWLAHHPVHKVQAWLGHELERTTEQLLPAAQAWIDSA